MRRSDQFLRLTASGLSIYRARGGSYWAMRMIDGMERGAAGSTEKNAIKNYQAFTEFLAGNPSNPFSFQNPYP